MLLNTCYTVSDWLVLRFTFWIRNVFCTRHRLYFLTCRYWPLFPSWESEVSVELRDQSQMLPKYLKLSNFWFLQYFYKLHSLVSIMADVDKYFSFSSSTIFLKFLSYRRLSRRCTILLTDFYAMSSKIIQLSSGALVSYISRSSPTYCNPSWMYNHSTFVVFPLPTQILVSKCIIVANKLCQIAF